MKLTPQYIAGFIDGETYLGIIRKLDEVQPYLIVKSEQAKILRRYIDLPRQAKENRDKSETMRSELYRNILSLNKQGLAETK